MLRVPGSKSRLRVRSGKSCSSLFPSRTILDSVSKYSSLAAPFSFSYPHGLPDFPKQLLCEVVKWNVSWSTWFVISNVSRMGLVNWKSPPLSAFCNMMVVENADSSKCQAWFEPCCPILIEQAPIGSALFKWTWQTFVKLTSKASTLLFKCPRFKVRSTS